MYDCMTKVSTDSYPTEKGFQRQICEILKNDGDAREINFNPNFCCLIEPVDILYQKAGFQLVDKVNT